MKKLIALLPLFCAVLATDAQYVTNLFTSATPPATLSEWAGRKEVLSYLVIAQAGTAQREVLIKSEIKLTDGTVVATTDLSQARTYLFRPGNTQLDAADVLPLDKMIFNGKYKTALARTGKLLSENYQLCVQLVLPGSFQPASEQKCRNFFIASLQLPILMKPFNEEELPATAAQTAVLFRWTPVVPKPATPVKYRVQIFEVLPGQQPMQAFRSNMPLADQEVLNITQFIWQPQLSVLNAYNSENAGDDDTLTQKAGVSTSRSNVRTKSANNNVGGGDDDTLTQKAGVSTSRAKVRSCFIWTVQTLDAAGNPLGDGNVNGDGRSEPLIFFIVPPQGKGGKEIDGLKEEIKKIKTKG